MFTLKLKYYRARLLPDLINFRTTASSLIGSFKFNANLELQPCGCLFTFILYASNFP